MPDQHHHILDRYLREHVDKRDALVPEAPAMPDAQRQALLEVVHSGIPRRPRRRRRTAYEDVLEEKRLRRKEGRTSKKSGATRALVGLGLRVLAGVIIMVVLAVIVFWWLDRASIREAERAGARPSLTGSAGTGGAGSSMDLFGPLPPPGEAPAPSVAAAPPEATPSVIPEPAPAVPVTTEIPLAEQVVRLAELAAQVAPRRSGVRVEFDPPPPDGALRKRLAAPDAPLMFRRVRIVQNDKGIEVTDRWDGSFYPVQVATGTVADIDPVARTQAMELPGVETQSPAVLVLAGKGTSFAINQEVQLRLELVLTEVPPEAAPTLRSGKAEEAFALWLAHSRLYGEATLENGARVVFEALPVTQ